MKQISIGAFREVLEAEGGNSSVDFINVCTPAEYAEKHIAGVRSVPLDELEKRVAEFGQKKTIYVHCRSGARGRRAIEKLASLGVPAELVNVEGGLLAWEGAGFSTIARAGGIPLMRQVFLAAGLIVLLGTFLSAVLHPAFAAIPAFVGAGLVFSGATGWCGMAYALGKMPWNKFTNL